MESTIRVLVVDDDPNLAELTGVFLERHDEDVVAVVETEAAAGLDRLDDVDCIVCDYDMPGMDGLDFLAAVRERDPDLPFVLFTAKGSEEIASRAISAGVTDYLRKGSGGERYEILANRVRNAVERYRTEDELERTEARYRRLVEQNLFGIYIVQDGRIEYANPELAALLGHDQAELVGMPFERFVGDDDFETVREQVRRRLEGEVEDVQYSFTVRRRDGVKVPVEVHSGLVEHDGEPAVMGALVEVGERERHVESLAALNRATQRLMRAENREAVGEVAVEAASQVLGLRMSGVFLREGDRLVPFESSDEGVDHLGQPPELPLDDSIAGSAYREGEPRVVDDVRTDEDVYDPETDIRSVLALPLGSHGVLVAGSTTAADFDEGDLSLARTLGASVEAALDRTEREKRLNELYATSRRLMAAPSRREVAQVAVDTARDVLGYELNGVHLVDESGERLPPAAVSERSAALLGSVPTLSVEDSRAGEALRTGEVQAYEDVREAVTTANPDTVMRRELVVPLGEHGVFIAGGPEAGAFEESEVSLARMFGATVEAALTRASREAAVRERETELRRQNERLEEFAGVVSHDLRNPLEVARGYTELARESNDSEELAAVARAHDRLASRIDELLALARGASPVEETETVDVGSLARWVWADLGDATDRPDGGGAAGATLTVADDTPAVRADPERLRLLVENLLANAVEHGSATDGTESGGAAEHGSTGGRRDSDDGVEHGAASGETQSDGGSAVTVRVGPLGGSGEGAGTGFYVADDGPGVPEADREAVFDYGHTTTRAAGGNGFGLAVVRTVADAHGWDVRLVESESGGARFEVRV